MLILEIHWTLLQIYSERMKLVYCEDVSTSAGLGSKCRESETKTDKLLEENIVDGGTGVVVFSMGSILGAQLLSCYDVCVRACACA